LYSFCGLIYEHKNLKNMKKILILLFSIGLAYGASAQRGHIVVGGGFYRGGGVVFAPRVGVGFGLGYPWGYPYGWYGPYYGAYPPYYYGYGAMPSQLELQVQEIRKDYDQQIKDVKHDKSLTRQERRQKVDALKTEREQAIVDARHDYFNRRYKSPQPKSNDNSSSSGGSEYQDKGPETEAK
jgi:hypothetical protein